MTGKEGKKKDGAAGKKKLHGSIEGVNPILFCARSFSETIAPMVILELKVLFGPLFLSFKQNQCFSP
jgi:hypothetical protein